MNHQGVQSVQNYIVNHILYVHMYLVNHQNTILCVHALVYHLGMFAVKPPGKGDLCLWECYQLPSRWCTKWCCQSIAVCVSIHQKKGHLGKRTVHWECGRCVNTQAFSFVNIVGQMIMMVTMSWRLTLVQIIAIYFVTVPEYFVNKFLEVCIFYVD